MNVQQERSRGLLACLGDASRYRIVATLADGERCVSDLAVLVQLSQSCTTRHLQALERAGLVVGQRRGRRVMFSLSTGDPAVADLLRWVIESPIPAAEAIPSVPGTPRPRPEAVEPARRTPQPSLAESRDEPEVTTEPPRRRDDLEDFLL